MKKNIKEDIEFCIEIIFLPIFASVIAALVLTIATSGFEGIAYSNRACMISLLASLIQIVATVYILKSEKLNNYDKQRISAKIILLIFIAITAFSSALEILMSLLKLECTGPWDDITGKKALIVLFATVIAAPISEELLFRGALFGRLRKNNSFLWAAIISSAIFGLAHGSVYADINAFFMGTCMCIAYEVTQNLTVGMLVHIVNNLIVFLFSENARITNIPDNPLVSILLVISCTGIAIMTAIKVYKSGSDTGLCEINE